MKRAVCFLMLVPCITLAMVGCEDAHENAQAKSGPEFSQQVTEAIQDLADRLGVTSGEVVLVREETVTWRDGSLGCPKKGMMYTQALVEGTLVVLRVAGRDYQYRSGKGRTLVFCENLQKPLPGPSAD